MTSTINASTSSGLIQTADTSGILKVQSNGVTTNALAWVNFNGTSSTPITPRSNYNVSSVTKNSTGNYTLNFTNSLTDANYAVSTAVGSNSTANAQSVLNIVQSSVSGGATTKSTTQLNIVSGTASTGGVQDNAECYVAIFGN